MNQLLRFVMLLLLALTLMLGQGLFELSEATSGMACCQKLSVATASSCCTHHQAVIINVHQANSSCFCSSQDQLPEAQASQESQHLKVLWVAACQPSTAHSLQLTDSGKPIWLYWQFYPDRSRLYQQKNSWLL